MEKGFLLLSFHNEIIFSLECDVLPYFSRGHNIHLHLDLLRFFQNCQKKSTAGPGMVLSWQWVRSGCRCHPQTMAPKLDARLNIPPLLRAKSTISYRTLQTLLCYVSKCFFLFLKVNTNRSSSLLFSAKKYR